MKTITSYGIILYRDVPIQSMPPAIGVEKDQHMDLHVTSMPSLSQHSSSQQSNKPIKEYLMICRKDTVSYVVFIRGLYTRSMIPILAERMTIFERQKIATKAFDELWDELWQYHPAKKYHHREKFKKQYDRAKSRFDRKDWEPIFNKIPSQYQDPEWGFPKGRKKKSESDLKAAIREFCEETGIEEQDIHLIRGKNGKVLTPFREYYMGSDSEHYEILYFLARMKDPCKSIPEIDVNYRSSEISKIQWFSKESAIETIRDYNKEKIAILQKLFVKQATHN
jgi:8-oxo-dGTP pyrophosphatase MutT (NUDIX family)